MHFAPRSKMASQIVTASVSQLTSETLHSRRILSESKQSTIDSIFDGDVELEQSVKGYRFNVDSALLAAFAGPFKGKRVLDACAGVGVIGIAVSKRRPGATLTLIEVQDSLADFAERNLERNGLQDRASVHRGDIRAFKGTGAHFDLAVMNPPYFAVDEGKTSPEGEKAIARHQINGALDELVASIHKHLLSQAWLITVFPAHRVGQLFHALEHVGRRRQIIQPIYPFENADASLMIVAARTSRIPEARFLKPLVLHDVGGQQYTDEASRILDSGIWPWEIGNSL